MKTDKLLFIDTETGGLEPTTNSLLSVALVVWQENKIIDSKEILINDGELNVTPYALKVNGINLEEHKTKAIWASDAITLIDSFLSRHFTPDEKIILAGHNINFDINFFKYFLNKYGYSFSKRFSHRSLDTSSILHYLYLAGKINHKAISSDEGFRLFGIKVDNRHTALGDAIATVQLFNNLLDIISDEDNRKRRCTDNFKLMNSI